MKSASILSPLIAASLLCACSDANDGTPREGQYLQTVKITELEFSGMTPELKQRTIRQMEQAAGGGTGGMFCMGGKSGQDWKKATSELARGLGGKCEKIKETGSPTKADIEVRCTGTPKGDVTAKITGEANSESYAAKMTMDVADPRSKETARVTMDISAKRVGKCPA